MKVKNKMRRNMKGRRKLNNMRGREVEGRSFVNSVRKNSKKVKIRRKLKADSAGPDSISDKDT